MLISDKGVGLIKNFEGCKLTAYRCPAGKWTIGYGWTGNVEGKPIAAGMQITQETAERLLRCGLVGFERDVNRLVKVQITQGMYDALVSFSYNVGISALSNSTLLKELNAGRYQRAADQFLNWVYAGGKKLPGLVRRREAERELFLSE